MASELSDFTQAALSSEPAVLAAVLAHLTGDKRWAADPRLEGLRQWRSGLRSGVDTDGQAFLADAAAELERMAENNEVDVPHLDDSELLDIARSAIDPQIDGRFIQKLKHHLDPNQCRVSIDPEAVKRRGLKVTIVGAGMSGISLAISLADAGIDYEVLEMRNEVGGVWFDNVYPECGVDTQAFQYAFDAEPNLDWSRYDVKRDEILQYVRDVAFKRGVADRTQFDTKVEIGTWDAGNAQWKLNVTRGSTPEILTTDVLVVAVGSLNRPKIPEVPGLDEFTGQIFHTARWSDDLALEGKRVAIIGSGSSGVQVTRTVAKLADQMFVFVRSPHWMRPRRPGEIGEVTNAKRWLLRHVPNYLAWYRFYLDYNFGDREHRRMVLDETSAGRQPSPSNDATREQLTAYIRQQLGERDDLIEKLTPTYPPYGKRLVVDNEWYATLTEPHVDLVTSEIASFDATGIRTVDGEHYDVDTVGFATGFHGTRYFWPMDLVSSDGERLAEKFGSSDDLRAYLGVMMADYPNLFALQGPNTAIGHGGGATFMSEGQGRFIMTCLKYLIEDEHRSITVKPSVVDDYNDLIDARIDQMVWTEPGLASRFKNSRGRVVTNHPFTLLEFWERSKSPRPELFSFDPLPDSQRAPMRRHQQ